MALVALLLALIPLLAGAPPRPVAVANDNRSAAGALRGGVLTLELEATEALWHPDAETDPGLVAYVFREAGKRPQVPGPTIRVPAGTLVRLRLTNHTGARRPLQVHGFTARPASAEDTLVVPAGETHSVEFRLDTPGTYLYYGTTTDSAFASRVTTDTQLSGALIVDEPGRPADDRVFVVNEWVTALAPDGGPAPGSLLVPVINGKSWPHTERLHYTLGDTVRWRVINASVAPHPMHLHGAYYTVHARGNLLSDRVYAPAERPQVVTDRMVPGSTMALSWVPLRGGNWLFHCHVPLHIAPHLPIGGVAHVAQSSAPMNHAGHDMGGLVLGVTVAGDPAAPVGAGPLHRLRLLAEANRAAGAGHASYRFRVDAPDGFQQPGLGISPSPVLLLRRGQDTGITVVNTLAVPTAVHWHGIELESYYDGVPGFGGTAERVTPMIAAGDSFVARFTPPRAGTFIYHTHVEELEQEPAGLAGMLLVLEPGTRFDRRLDHPLLFMTPPGGERADYLINGVAQPPAFEWRAGETHHLRIVNMTIGFPGGLAVSVSRDTAVMRWLPTAKDGAPVPGPGAVLQPATVLATIGETFDFDIALPDPGDYVVRVRAARAGRGPVRTIPIHVR